MSDRMWFRPLFMVLRGCSGETISFANQLVRPFRLLIQESLILQPPEHRRMSRILNEKHSKLANLSFNNHKVIEPPFPVCSLL